MKNKKFNRYALARSAGYHPIGTTDRGELNCLRELGGAYPRFHAYISESRDIIRFTIHLDQKKPSYEGTTAHSGDYNSDIVAAEVQRIKDILYR